MGPADLEDLISRIAFPDDERIIVPPGDDGGVFLLRDGLAIVETVDVITPLVNDPFVFGQISSANSLSDVYAMGGVPVTALAISGFSYCDYEIEVFQLILEGAIDIMQRAGARLLGGHSFEDRELKFGLSVTGILHNERVLRKGGAKEGDLLVLTKPIGTGVLTTALKGGKLSDTDLEEAVKWMTTLNDRASATALKAKAHACTDVTGFGLLGHAHNMVRDTKVEFVIYKDRVPVLDGVRELVELGMVPEGAYNNLNFLKEKIEASARISEEDILILSDPQTSGGLLIALKEEGIELFEDASIPYWIIGEVRQGAAMIRVR